MLSRSSLSPEANGPRPVLEHRNEALPITQATEVPMARAATALHSPVHSRNPYVAALAHELDAAIWVWVDLPLQSARTRKVTRHIAALEARLASLQGEEVRHV